MHQNSNGAMYLPVIPHILIISTCPLPASTDAPAIAIQAMLNADYVKMGLLSFQCLALGL
jgi:hypothetical protein